MQPKPIPHQALLEWARDNGVLHLEYQDLKADFMPKPQAGPDAAPPNETPEERQKRLDRITFHSAD